MVWGGREFQPRREHRGETGKFQDIFEFPCLRLRALRGSIPPYPAPGAAAMSLLSPAKLAANRANAQKSTGPRTPDGKAASRLNALTHGLCARIPLVPGEDPEERERRYGVWAAELKPHGEIEL